MLEKFPASFRIPGIRASHSPNTILACFTGFGLPSLISELDGILLGPVLVGVEAAEIKEETAENGSVVSAALETAA